MNEDNCIGEYMFRYNFIKFKLEISILLYLDFRDDDFFSYFHIK